MTYAWRSSSNGEKSELAKLDNELILLFSKCLQKKRQIVSLKNTNLITNEGVMDIRHNKEDILRLLLIINLRSGPIVCVIVQRNEKRARSHVINYFDRILLES